MTPEQKIKHLILIRDVALTGRDDDLTHLTAEQVEQRYDALVEAEEHWDATSEVREGEVETDLPCEWSRHYESKAVAAQYVDGTWVGWTHWYGGGKHGQPEAVEWVSEAYDLRCTEEEKVVTVRTFKKADAA